MHSCTCPCSHPGFYTLAKLTLVPTTCWLEAVLLSRSFSLQLMACIATALLGVGVITVTGAQRSVHASTGRHRQGQQQEGGCCQGCSHRACHHLPTATSAAVADISISLPDLIMGALFVASTSGQQVMCGRLQAMHKLRPHQLLLPTATAQGSLLLVAGPFLDKLFTGSSTCSACSCVCAWRCNGHSANGHVIGCLMSHQ